MNLPQWAVSIFNVILVWVFGGIAFRLGMSYGARRERQKPRVLHPLQVIEDKLNLAYRECKETGNLDGCAYLAEVGERVKQGNTMWSVTRIFVDVEERP